MNVDGSDLCVEGQSISYDSLGLIRFQWVFCKWRLIHLSIQNTKQQGMSCIRVFNIPNIFMGTLRYYLLVNSSLTLKRSCYCSVLFSADTGDSFLQCLCGVSLYQTPGVSHNYRLDNVFESVESKWTWYHHYCRNALTDQRVVIDFL